jgi:prepilin-type N-terminal cleavage/methylation domain-containing protein
MKRNRKQLRRGFSLLEIMLVLVILVVVGGIVAVNLGRRSRSCVPTNREV